MVIGILTPSVILYPMSIVDSKTPSPELYIFLETTPWRNYPIINVKKGKGEIF